jgi:hypothetical protein
MRDTMILCLCIHHFKSDYRLVSVIIPPTKESNLCWCYTFIYVRIYTTAHSDIWYKKIGVIDCMLFLTHCLYNSFNWFAGWWLKWYCFAINKSLYNMTFSFPFLPLSTISFSLFINCKYLKFLRRGYKIMSRKYLVTIEETSVLIIYLTTHMRI